MTRLVLEDFTPHAGSTFTLSEEDMPPLALVLESADKLPDSGAPTAMRAPFSLIFRCADERVMPQKIYNLAHEGMGEQEIFLVPVGKDAAGVTYQAVFA